MRSTRYWACRPGAWEVEPSRCQSVVLLGCEILAPAADESRARRDQPVRDEARQGGGDYAPKMADVRDNARPSRRLGQGQKRAERSHCAEEDGVVG